MARSDDESLSLSVVGVTSDVGHFRTYTITVSDRPTIGPKTPIDVPEDVANALTDWLGQSDG